MKKILLIGALLMLSAMQTLALSIEAVPETLQKGETLILRGNCTSEITLTGKVKENEILNTTIPCETGFFTHRFEVSLLFPSGNAEFNARENQESVHTAVRITQSRESAFYTIEFLSPVEVSVERASTIDLRIRLTENQAPVANARVQSFQLTGSPIPLAPIGNGIYAARIPIPFDTATGNRSLVVTAQSADSAIGGENSLTVPIEPARILVRLESPASTTLFTYTTTRFEAGITYADGSPLQNPVVTLRINGEEHALTPQTDTRFAFETRFFPNQIGKKQAVLLARDSADNTAEYRTEVFITESIIDSGLRIAPYALAAVLALGIAFLVVIPRIKTKKTIQGTNRRLDQIESDITTLQTAYFEKHAMSSEAYQKKFNSLEKEKSELQKKLNT